MKGKVIITEGEEQDSFQSTKMKMLNKKNIEQELYGESKSEKMPEREQQNDMSTGGVLMIGLIR